MQCAKKGGICQKFSVTKRLFFLFFDLGNVPSSTLERNGILKKNSHFGTKKAFVPRRERGRDFRFKEGVLGGEKHLGKVLQETSIEKIVTMIFYLVLGGGEIEFSQKRR